jgi:peptidoglycan hydrolase-like protein with peptidoglycan-binding domain
MMQRFLTAAAVVSTMALATSGLALAQSATTSPSGAMNPSTSAPATTTPGMTPSSGMTNPSTGSMSSPNASGPSAQNDTAGMNAQSPRDIRQAQQQLKSQGLYNGRVDGKMGPETAQAISKFQQQNGLPQNSQLDQQTLAKLGGNGSGTGMSTNGSGSSTPPASMTPSTSNPGAGSSMGSGGASTPSGTTSMPNATGDTSTSH